MTTIANSRGQQPAKESHITGIVVDSLSSRPIAGALVKSMCSPSPSKVTDAIGRFVFNITPEAAERPCNLSVELDGFLSFAGAGNAFEDAKIELVPEAVIRGTIVDENGGPFRPTGITILQRTIQFGRATSGLSGVGVAQSNEQGRFRIGKLSSGHYKICISPYPSVLQYESHTVYPVSCNPPLTALDNSGWFDLHSGESRDLSFRATPEKGGSISGKVTNPESGMICCLGADYPLPVTPSFPTGAIVNEGTGEFTFQNLPAGKYHLDIQSADEHRRAFQSFEVAANDIGGIELTLQPTPILSGKIRTDDGSPWPKVRVLIDLIRLSGTGGATISASPDGSFRTEIRVPNTYRLDTSAEEPWHVRSVTLGGRDLLAEGIVVQTQNPDPLDVVISRAAGSIEVSIPPDANGNVAPAAITLLRRTNFGIESAATTPLGPPFQFKNVAPGHYLLFAWPFPTNEIEYLNADFLKTMDSFGREIEVVDGSTTRVELEIAKPR